MESDVSSIVVQHGHFEVMEFGQHSVSVS